MLYKSASIFDFFTLDTLKTSLYSNDVKFFREIVKKSFKPTPFKLLFAGLLALYDLPFDITSVLNLTCPGYPCGYHLPKDFWYVMDRAMSMGKLYIFNTFFLPHFVYYYLIFSVFNGYIFSVAMALNETLRKPKKPSTESHA